MSNKQNAKKKEQDDFLKREEERAERRRREEVFQRQRELHSELSHKRDKGVSIWAKGLLFFYFLVVALSITLYFGISKKGPGPFEEVFKVMGI